MDYYYYKDSRGNVGDDLNAILLPHFFDDTTNKHLKRTVVGIGTLINDKLPDAAEYVFLLLDTDIKTHLILGIKKLLH